MKEFVLGGVATSFAAVFTNPLEVVKTRMQIQGELKHRGAYPVYYKNVFHAFVVIAKNDGLLALQSGLVPALWYQFVMNGARLGSFQAFVDYGLTKTASGDVSFPRTLVAGAASGCIGAYLASPLYLVKTHLQTNSTSKIAIGDQHEWHSMSDGLRKIYTQHGIQGLFRGVSAALLRVSMGSAAQLSTFAKSREMIDNSGWFQRNSWKSTLMTSCVSGSVVVALMTPFDVVSTRLYNQQVSKDGRGAKYKGVFDCILKMFRSEGLWGFYKGWGASFTRLAPHTVLSLVFWSELRKFYHSLEKSESK